MKNFLRSFLIIAFFISTLFLSFYSERVFVSPDENINFFFAQQFAKTGSLSVTESLDSTLGGIIHPRSSTVMGDTVLPGSFVGMAVAAGLLMKVFGDAGALLLTPLLALLGVLAFRTTIKKLFEDEALADVSALFLMLHPAYLYFSGRVMMHNVVFVDLIIFAVYFMVARPFGVKSRFSRELHRFECFLAGIMVGISIFFRTSEIVWVLPIAIVLLIAFRNNLGWRNISVFIFGLSLMLLITGWANDWVYGSPFVTGYTAVNPTALVAVDAAPPTTPVIERISSVPTTPSMGNLITQLPTFGLHPRAVMRNLWNYGVLLYPWMTITSVLGFGLLATRRFEKNKAWKTLSIVSVFVAGFLVLFYGSWNFADNPDPSLITIGNSHVRYWLPLFTLASPFAAYFVVSLWRGTYSLSVHRILQVASRAFIVIAVSAGLATNIWMVVYGHDGIVQSRAAMSSFISKRMRVLLLTEAESVIIVDRADKYLFPYRRVIVPLRDERTYSALKELVKDVPTYYFGITFPQKDLDYLNNDKLAKDSLRIELIETMNEESLYKFSHAQSFSR